MDLVCLAFILSKEKKMVPWVSYSSIFFLPKILYYYQSKIILSEIRANNYELLKNSHNPVCRV